MGGGQPFAVGAVGASEIPDVDAVAGNQPAPTAIHRLREVVSLVTKVFREPVHYELVSSTARVLPLARDKLPSSIGTKVFTSSYLTRLLLPGRRVNLPLFATLRRQYVVQDS